MPCSMRRWLRIHAVRSFTCDLPAWVCFVVAKIVVRMLGGAGLPREKGGGVTVTVVGGTRRVA